MGDIKVLSDTAAFPVANRNWFAFMSIRRISFLIKRTFRYITGNTLRINSIISRVETVAYRRGFDNAAKSVRDASNKELKRRDTKHQKETTKLKGTHRRAFNRIENIYTKKRILLERRTAAKETSFENANDELNGLINNAQEIAANLIAIRARNKKMTESLLRMAGDIVGGQDEVGRLVEQLSIVTKNTRSIGRRNVNGNR